MAPVGRRSDHRCRPGIVFWGNCQTVEFRLFINILSSGNSRTSTPAVTGGRSRAGRPEQRCDFTGCSFSSESRRDLAVHWRTCGTAGRRRSRSSGRGGGSRRGGQRISVNRLGYWHLALPNILSNLLYVVSRQAASSRRKL